MSVSNPGTISRFVEIYKGVEDFYFLNREGELGYIKSGEPRSVKETFRQLNDSGFLKRNPGFTPGLESFLRRLADIAAVCQSGPPLDLELGYILPADDQNQNQWSTATLVLHQHVVDGLKADHGMMVQNGIKEPAQAERDLARVTDVRSIHQGLDELIHHRDAFGHYRYFPALFIMPNAALANQPGGSRSSVRVINLRWRDEPAASPGKQASDSRQTRELVFSALRENLSVRGAIDRSQRLENRLSIA